MNGIKLLKQFIGMVFLISLPVWAFASKGEPVCGFSLIQPATNYMQSDTLLPPKKNTEHPKDQPADPVIKVVPLARKQVIPIPLDVNIKPVKIIQPKIKVIKPVIRILQ